MVAIRRLQKMPRDPKRWIVAADLSWPVVAQSKVRPCDACVGGGSVVQRHCTVKEPAIARARARCLICRQAGAVDRRAANCPECWYERWWRAGRRSPSCASCSCIAQALALCAADAGDDARVGSIVARSSAAGLSSFRQRLTIGCVKSRMRSLGDGVILHPSVHRSTRRRVMPAGAADPAPSGAECTALFNDAGICRDGAGSGRDWMKKDRFPVPVISRP